MLLPCSCSCGLLAALVWGVAQLRSRRVSVESPTTDAFRPFATHLPVTCRLARGEELLKLKDDEALDFARAAQQAEGCILIELRGQYAALTAQGNNKEHQREMGVSC